MKPQLEQILTEVQKAQKELNQALLAGNKPQRSQQEQDRIDAAVNKRSYWLNTFCSNPQHQDLLLGLAQANIRLEIAKISYSQDTGIPNQVRLGLAQRQVRSLEELLQESL